MISEEETVGDRTAHMLSHFATGLNDELVRDIISTIIFERKNDIEEVSRSWLNKKGTNLEGYKKNIIRKGVKLDELGITLFCMSVSCHVGIINGDETIWTTCATNDIEDCDMIFLNRGDMTFDMIEEKETDEEGGLEGKDEERGEMSPVEGFGQNIEEKMSGLSESMKGKIMKRKVMNLKCWC